MQEPRRKRRGYLKNSGEILITPSLTADTDEYNANIQSVLKYNLLNNLGDIMSFVRIWIHVVFGTKCRDFLLADTICMKVCNHILENAKNKNIHINCINGYSDHLHLLISMNPDQNIATVMNLLKGESSHWINQNSLTKVKFEWADEYYAVSVSETAVKTIKQYIANQKEHHKKKSYAEECEFLKNM